MADAKNYYVCTIKIYAGQKSGGPFKVDNSAIGVVSRLTSEISGSGRNFMFDNWYTTFPLIQMLFKDHKLIEVVTL